MEMEVEVQGGMWISPELVMVWRGVEPFYVEGERGRKGGEKG